MMMRRGARIPRVPLWGVFVGRTLLAWVGRPPELLHLCRQIFGVESLVFVCGGNAMGQGVHATLLNIVQRVGGLSPGQAREFVQELRASGRYVAEHWGGKTEAYP